MTILNSVTITAPGIGAANYKASTLGSVLTAGSGKTVTVPASGSLTPYANVGRIRVKSVDNAASSGSTALVTKITGTDGTTTVLLYPGGTTATGADVNLDQLYDFLTDLNLTSITVTLTIGTATALVDVEVVYAV